MLAVRQLRYTRTIADRRLYSASAELASKMASNSEIKNTKTMKKKPPIAIAWKEEDYNYKGLARLAKHYGPVYRIDMGIV